MCQGAEVAPVLSPNRLVQPIRTLQVGHDLGRQRLLLIERASRGCANQKKSNGDDDEQGRNRAGEAGQEVAQHPAQVYRLTARWTSEAAILKLARRTCAGILKSPAQADRLSVRGFMESTR